MTVTSETEAHKYQQKIEETLQTTLEINLKPGNLHKKIYMFGLLNQSVAIRY